MLFTSLNIFANLIYTDVVFPVFKEITDSLDGCYILINHSIYLCGLDYL